MNILVKAIQDAMYVIPERILVKAFMTGNNYRGNAETLENMILTKVITKRVVPDAQIAKGEHMNIRLDGTEVEWIQDYRCIYQIPSHKLQNKTILSVLNVSYTPYAGGVGAAANAYGGVGPLFTNDVMTATQQMVEASSAIPNICSARVELIGENTILLEDPQRYNTAYWLSCYVTDSNYLNKIDPRSYEYFSTLCEYAIKSYIYRTLIVDMGRAYIEGGAELGIFKDLVDEYKDSETNYRTFLREKWARIAWIDSRSRYTRLIKGQFPIGL